MGHRFASEEIMGQRIYELLDIWQSDLVQISIYGARKSMINIMK